MLGWPTAATAAGCVASVFQCCVPEPCHRGQMFAAGWWGHAAGRGDVLGPCRCWQLCAAGCWLCAAARHADRVLTVVRRAAVRCALCVGAAQHAGLDSAYLIWRWW